MTTNLKLPNNYVELSQEEMMYLDGGWNGWWNSVGFVGSAIDVALMAFGVLSIKGALAKKWISRNVNRAIGAVLKVFGIRGLAGWKVNQIIRGLVNIANMSVGFMIAGAIDWADGWFGGRSNNGHCFG